MFQHIAIRQSSIIRDLNTYISSVKTHKYSGLPYCHHSIHGCLNHKKAPMKNIPAPVTNCRRENIESRWFITVDVKEYSAASHIILNLLQHIIPNTFKQRMSWSHPFKCGIIFQK